MDSCSFRSSSDAAFVNCRVAVAGDNINIYPEESKGELIIWNTARLSYCDYTAGELVARYQDGELRCYGDTASLIFRSWNGRSQKRPDHTGRRLFRNLVITIGLGFLVLLALLYFVVLPWVAEKAVRLIPKEMEIELGQKMSASMRAGHQPSETDSLLNAFAEAMDFQSGYPLKLHVQQSPQINAFALPGGNIFVYTGIIDKMDSPEQLAALLAHEVTHVEKRHSMRSVCRSMASGLFIAAVFGDAGGVSGAIISQADEFRNLSYSRDLETEADLNGLELLRLNNIPEQGMLKLLELLDREGERAPAMMKYLSTHPETGDRIKEVQKNLSGTNPETSVRLWEIFKEIKSSLQK